VNRLVEQCLFVFSKPAKHFYTYKSITMIGMALVTKHVIGNLSRKTSIRQGCISHSFHCRKLCISVTKWTPSMLEVGMICIECLKIRVGC